MLQIDFQQRIGFEGDLTPFLQKVCDDYKLGKYISYKIVPVGYEDFNVILSTDSDTFFLKFLAKFRSGEACERYVDVMVKAIQSGVKHPKLLKIKDDYLYQAPADGTAIRLCVMEYIDGVSFYEGKLKATRDEMRFLIRQAALINKMDVHPKQVYDIWAIVHFLEEFERKKSYLGEADIELIHPLVKDFSALDIKKLPHCFVHGDIIKTNVIRSKNGELSIFDFSVASRYPRVQELAVLLCNMLFDEDKPETFDRNYRLSLSEYRKYNSFTAQEEAVLPLFVKVAHAMHVLCATYEREVNNNESPENRYWIDLGRKGLAYMSQ